MGLSPAESAAIAVPIAFILLIIVPLFALFYFCFLRKWFRKEKKKLTFKRKIPLSDVIDKEGELLREQEHQKHAMLTTYTMGNVQVLPEKIRKHTHPRDATIPQGTVIETSQMLRFAPMVRCYNVVHNDTCRIPEEEDDEDEYEDA